LTGDAQAKPVDVPVGGDLDTLEWHPHDPILALGIAKPGEAPAVVLLDLTAGKALATCEPGAGRINAGPVSLAFSPDGRWLAVGVKESTVRVYGARDGAERFRLTDAVINGVNHLQWTPDGELGVTGEMEGLRVWRPDPDPSADTLYRLR